MSKKKPNRPNRPSVKSKEVSISDNSAIYYNKNLHYLFLFFSAFLLYGWTYTFNYNLDDDYILNYFKDIDTGLENIKFIFSTWFANADYRPVSILSFWVERSIFDELTPGISHLVNVFIYGILLIKIYDFVISTKFLTDTKVLSIIALLSAILFLVHPNHVSVVANIKSRDNLLSMLFGIIACIQLIKLFDDRKLWRIPLFLIFITLGLLSKLDCYSFLAIPVLVIFLFRQVNVKRILLFITVTFILGFISIKIRGYFIDDLDQNMLLYKMKVTDNPLLTDDSFINRLSLALTSLFYYLKFLFVPYGYYFFFGFKEISTLPLFSFINIIALTAFVLISVAALYYYNKNKIYLFCWLFFLISILYALNFFTKISGIVSDRYNFIASLGFCIALANVLYNLISKPDIISLVKNKYLLFLLFIYCSFTISRTFVWKDEFTLYENDLPHIPNSLNAYRIAAGTYIHKALEEEQKPNFNRELADDYINKGEKHAMTALGIYDKSAQIWELLGLCASYKKNYKDALEKFSNCYKSDTTYLSGINYLGYAYWNVNQIDSALYYFNYVAKREPFFGFSANNMVNMLQQQRRYKEADSILIVLKNRFPNDEKLNNKIERLKK